MLPPCGPLLLIVQDSLSLSAILLTIGVALMAFCVVVWLQQRRGQPGRPPLTPHEELERARQTRGLEKDLTQLTAEIEEMTRRFTAELDSRTTHLEQLIQQAETRIATLRELTSAGPVAARPGAAAPGRTPAPAPAPDIPDDPLARLVYRLADKGVPAPDIARQLNEHIGKVELILALRQP